MLLYERALTIERTARAARIVDVNLGTNGGKEAQNAVRDLGRD